MVAAKRTIARPQRGHHGRGYNGEIEGRDSAASCRAKRATIPRRLATRDLPMLATFDRVLIRANRWLVVAILGAMAAMVFVNVALRFLTDHSILWVEELSRYLMIWLTFLGSGLVLRYGAHVGIDTLQDRFPRLAPKIRAVIVFLLLVFFATMIWLGARYVVLTWGQTTPVLQIPIGAVYLAVPIGFALMVLHLLLMAAPYVRQSRVLSDEAFDADAVKL
jgi:TRAP-type transport system small permease protein